MDMASPTGMASMAGHGRAPTIRARRESSIVVEPEPQVLIAWLLAGVGLLMIALSGLFVAAEFSLVTVSRTVVEQGVTDGVRGAAGLQTALRSLSTQLSGAQVGITLTNLLIGWSAEPSIATLIGPVLGALGVPEDAVEGVSLTVALVIATILTMVFGELVPQNLALAHSFGVSRIVQAPQRWFTTVSRPLTMSLNRTSNAIVRLCGVEPREELASARSPEELVSVVRASAQSGHIPAPTADLVERSLRFEQLQARDVLTPRTKVVSAPASAPVQRVVDLAAEHGLSRFPVSGADFDDVVGVVELSRTVGVPPARRRRVRVGDVAEPALFVPHTARLDEMLAAMRDKVAELVVVLDEYGGTAGVITFEDLVEELVGDVEDEHDWRSTMVSHRDDEGEVSWSVSGLLRPDELEHVTGIRLPENPHRYETVAGLVVHTLGRVPQIDDHVTIDDVTLRVERLDRRRIDVLRVARTNQPTVEE